MKIYKCVINYLIITLIVFSIYMLNINDKIDTDIEYVYASSEIIDKDNVIKDDNINIDVNVDTNTNDDKLEVQVGKLSRYGSDCYLCSGYLAYGIYVGNGDIYYNDSYYGNVRILAGDNSYPFGTIVRISYDDYTFLGIVLDRGGSIGFGKNALFDLLYPSEYLANIDGVNYNTKFEILRYGF